MGIPRKIFSRSALAAFVFSLSLPLLAQPARPVWTGDLASGRAYLVDAAKLYELKRRQSVTVKAVNTISALEAVARGQADVVGSARGPDPRTPLAQDLVDVVRLFAIERAQAEVVDDEHVEGEEAADETLRRVIGARLVELVARRFEARDFGGGRSALGLRVLA